MPPKKKKKQGRPSKFDDEKVKKIINALERGVSKSDAARYCGINLFTLHSWMKRKPEFAQKCREAMAKASVLAHGQEVNAIMDGQPWAIQSFLNREERRRANRENMRMRREELRAATGADKSNNVQVATDAYYEKLKRELDVKPPEDEK